MWTTVKSKALGFDSWELLHKAIPLNEAFNNIILWFHFKFQLKPTTSAQVLLLLARIGKHADCSWTGSSLRDVGCPSAVGSAWRVLPQVNITTILQASPFREKRILRHRELQQLAQGHTASERQRLVLAAKTGKIPKGKVNLMKWESAGSWGQAISRHAHILPLMSTPWQIWILQYFIQGFNKFSYFSFFKSFYNNKINGLTHKLYSVF